MKIFSFAANKFHSIDDLGFSAEEYSKLKYGSKRVARIFGTELAKKFLNYNKMLILDNIEGTEVVISSAPYKFIPVASTILKDYFVSGFNRVWAETNKSVQDLKV